MLGGIGFAIRFFCHDQDKTCKTLKRTHNNNVLLQPQYLLTHALSALRVRRVTLIGSPSAIGSVVPTP